MLRIEKADQLVAELNKAYYARLYAPGGEPGMLDVLLAPGTYRDLRLSLDDPTGQGRLSLALRADGGPVVFENASLTLAGASIELEGLVFSGGRGRLPALQLLASERIALRRCALVDRRWSGPPGGVLALLRARRGATAVEVSLEDDWFVGNGGERPSTLLSLAPDAGAGFSTVSLSRVAFVGNENAALLSPSGVDALELRDALLLSSGEGVFLALDRPATRVELRGGLLLAPSWGSLLRRAASPPRPESDFAPVRLRELRIGLENGGEPPPGVELDGVREASLDGLDRGRLLGLARERALALEVPTATSLGLE